MRGALTLVDFAAISPLLILLCGALLILLVESFAEAFSKKNACWLTQGILAIAFVAALTAPASTNPLLTAWLYFDPMARFFTVLFIVIGMGSALLSESFFERFKASHGEYFFLLLSSLFGLILIGAAADFLTLFLGIETLSISLYILCGYMKKWNLSHESAFKYFLMGSLAAAFLLYGVALIYGAVGTTRLDALLPAFPNLDQTQRIFFLSAIAFVTVGIAFEAAVVPFHFWAPDVYEGAPTPVTAFMAVGTKAGAFAAFVRVFMESMPHIDLSWNRSIELLIYLTLFYANFVAIRQKHMRRFFAYSGISHAGFLLIPVVVGGQEAFSALAFYLVIYVIATLGCFSVLAYLDHDSKGVDFHDLQGLFKRFPYLAGIFTVCLLTLAGIPPTAGFLAKFYVFKVAFQAGFYGLVFAGLLASILAAFYYLRIIGLMLAEVPEKEGALPRLLPASLVGVASFIVLVVLSFFPAPFFDWLVR